MAARFGMTSRCSIYANSFVDNNVMFGLDIKDIIFDWIRSLSTHTTTVMLQPIEIIYYEFSSSSLTYYFRINRYIVLITDAHIKSSEILQFSASMYLMMRANFPLHPQVFISVSPGFCVKHTHTHTHTKLWFITIYGLT
jgi:aromatic ring-opening dioxygenase LigB subunit